MKKITANEIMAHWGNNNITPILAAFEEMSAELEALEGRKGFVVDWSKAPEWAKSASLVFCQGSNGLTVDSRQMWEVFSSIPRPIPPKVTRDRTRVWKIARLVDLGWESYEALKMCF